MIVQALVATGLGEADRKAYACWLLQNFVTCSPNELAVYCGGKAVTWKGFLLLFANGKCEKWRATHAATEAQLAQLCAFPPKIPKIICASGFHRGLFDGEYELQLLPRDAIDRRIFDHDLLALGESSLFFSSLFFSSLHFSGLLFSSLVFLSFLFFSLLFSSLLLSCLLFSSQCLFAFVFFLVVA
jgi:hypothetical protein